MKTLRSIIELQKGDITKATVDAIVNAANTSLLGGGELTVQFIELVGKQFWTTVEKLLPGKVVVKLDKL